MGSIEEYEKEFHEALKRKVNRDVVEEFGGLKINYPHPNCLWPEDVDRYTGGGTLPDDKLEHARVCRFCRILINLQE